MRARLTIVAGSALLLSVFGPSGVTWASGGRAPVLGSRAGGPVAAQLATPTPTLKGRAQPPPTGPPWTYQMARIGLFLLLLLALGVTVTYRRILRARRRA